jgi:hypothetical protein
LGNIWWQRFWNEYFPLIFPDIRFRAYKDTKKRINEERKTNITKKKMVSEKTRENHPKKNKLSVSGRTKTQHNTTSRSHNELAKTIQDQPQNIRVWTCPRAIRLQPVSSRPHWMRRANA